MQSCCFGCFLTSSLPSPSWLLKFPIATERGEGGGGEGLYGEALPKRGTFFRMEVHKRVGISPAQVYKRGGKTVI